jgi:hypothetical protein
MRASITLAAAAFAVATLPASAEMVVYKATLSSAMEVPPNDSRATGDIEATYDTTTHKLFWKGEYKGLSGAVTAAHFHGPAAAGANAPPAVAVKIEKSPFSGEAMLTAAQAADLAKGQWYFNIHTDKNKGGEIRGQMMK